MSSSYFSLIDFIDQFHSEDDCQDHLFLVKNGDYPYCINCQSKRVSRITTRGYGYYCLDCGHQFSVTKDTIFENTKIPLRKWFLAIYLMTADKRGISALDLSRKLSITHPTAMVLLKALRHLMIDDKQKFILEGTVEMDEFFVGSSGGTAGRGTSKAKILIALSFNLPSTNTFDEEESEDFNPEDERYAMYLKMTHVDNLTSETINRFVSENIHDRAIIITDSYRGYNKIVDLNFEHVKQTYDPNNQTYHTLHTIISNFKSFVLGTYHGGFQRDQLQNYLDEFTFRFNHRKESKLLFDILLELCVFR